MIFLTIPIEGVKIMVFNATFNNISVILWRSVFLLEEKVALNTIILTPSMGMVRNTTNINKTNSYLSPQLIENKKDHNNYQWKSRSCLETGTKSMSSQ
jgi:hypothetical protein